MKGIVLLNTRFADHKSIASLYTKEYGMLAFMVPRGSGRSGKRFVPLLMPFSLVDLAYQHHPNKDIQTPKDVQLLFRPNTPVSSPVGNAVVAFLLEFYTKLLRLDLEGDDAVFNFIERNLYIVDELDNYGLASLHLHCMARMLIPLGIAPETLEYRYPSRLLISEGRFETLYPVGDIVASQYEAEHSLVSMLKQDIDQPLMLNRASRKALMKLLLNYYHHHIPHLVSFKSLDILEKLFE